MGENPPVPPGIEEGFQGFLCRLPGLETCPFLIAALETDMGTGKIGNRLFHPPFCFPEVVIIGIHGYHERMER